MQKIKIKELKEEYVELVDLCNKCIKDGKFNSNNELGYSILDYAKTLSKLEDIEKIIKMDMMAKDKKEKKVIRNFISKNREDILKLHDDKCDICELDIVDILEIHHILPISNGGDNSLDNLSCLCPNCHAILHKMLDNCKKNIDGIELENALKNNMSFNAYDKLQKMFIKSVKLGAY